MQARVRARACSRQRIEHTEGGRPPVAAPWRSTVAALMLAAIATPALGDRALTAPGDNEIRIGNTVPYTVPVSAYGVIGEVMGATFEKINAEGGVRERKAQQPLDRNTPLSSKTTVSSASGALPSPSPPSASSLSPQERDPLYREFREWRAKRAKAGAPSR
jgi:hypothetical protein